MVLRIFLFLFSLNAFSQAHHQCLHNDDGIIACVPNDHHLEGGEESFPQQILDWWAATKTKVRDAKCQNAGSVSREQMIKSLIQDDTLLVNDSFFGMSFENESPHKLELLKKLTQFDGFWNFNEEDNISSQKTFSIPNDCHKVLCAAESIFGKEEAPKLLYLLDKYELNLSHVTDDNLTAFSSDQLDTILEAVDDLPSHLIPFEKNQYFKHYKNGYGPSETTIANATITLYDPWDDQSSDEMRMYTVIHEIGHNIGGRLNQDEDPEWLSITGWFEIDGEWKSAKDDEQVSRYGATNPAEDFAEAFSGYRYDPEKLKELSPEKYEYMKNNVFLGIEYTSEEKCKNSNSDFAKIRDILKTEQPIPEKFSSCNSEINELISKGSTNLKSCIEKAIISANIEAPENNRSKFAKDAINQALSFEEFSGNSISKKQEEEAYKKILGDLFGSIAKEYYNLNESCDDKDEYAWQNFMSFNQYHFRDKYYNLIESNNDLQPLMKNICQKLWPKKQANCKDLAPIMQEYIPSHLEINIDPQKVSSSSDGDPNDFRCEIN